MQRRRIVACWIAWLTAAWPAVGDEPRAGAPAPAPPVVERARVALTFDDLPNHGPLPPGLTRSDVVRALLAILKQHGAPPSYGFVNARGLADGEDQRQTLRLWRAAGHPLGNHAFSHMDLNTHSVAEFEQDVVAGEPALREHMGDGDWRWFRFPYLRQGETVEKRRAVADFLRRRGYRTAEVTLDPNDWAVTDAYARCSARGDAAAVERLERGFLERAADTLARGRREARSLFGREVAHVLLLHAGAFTAHVLPRLLDLLAREGFDVVELPEAASDAIYAAVPEQATPEGLTLLEQVRRVRGRDGGANDAPRPPLDELRALCR